MSGSTTRGRADRILRALCALGIAGMLVLVAYGATTVLSPPSDPIVANPELATTRWIVGDPPMRTVLTLETAVTAEQQRRGLMARDSIGRHDGMAFPWRGGPAAFWMRGTRIPLDIAYVGTDGRVLRVVRGLPMDETLLPSGAPVSLVVEVAAGRSRLLGLVPGARVARDAGR